MDETKTKNSERRYETRDANIRNLVIFAVGLFMTLVVTLLGMFGLFDYFVGRQGLGPPASPLKEADVRALPPAGQPRLQVTPARDLKQYRAGQDALLHSYGWVDQQAGIVRIPIDRAMELLVQRGFPVRGSAPSKPNERLATGHDLKGRFRETRQDRASLAAASPNSR